MLLKTIRMSAGAPGAPGTPARPAYTEIITRTCYRLIGERFIPEGEEFGGALDADAPFWATVYEPYTCTEALYHPATPAVAPVAPTPPVDVSLGWNAAAYSLTRLNGDLETEFQVPGGAGIFVGFVHESNSVTYRRLTHSLYFHGLLVNVFESGSLVWGVTGFTPDDVWKIERVAGVVTYYKNGTDFYESLVASSGSLVVGASLYAGGDQVD